MKKPAVLPALTILTMLALAVTTPAAAQSTAGINAGIQFDFSLPGARSLGIAGAFVAVADDATASQANPAGLTLLSRPQLSVEGRLWNFFSVVPTRGHVFGAPTGFGVDTIEGIEDGELKDSTKALAFISFVYPKGDWAVSGYRHQFSNFRNRTEIEGPFQDFSDGRILRTNPTRNSIAIEIVNYGGSVARRLGKLSLGGSVMYSRFELNSQGTAYLLFPFDSVIQRGPAGAGFTGVGQIFGTPDFSDQNRFFREVQEGKSNAFGAAAGFLYRGSDRWTVGAAYRLAPVHKFDAQFSTAEAFGRFGPGFPPPGTIIDSDQDILFHVPDSLAVGFTYSPTQTVKLAFEYDLVRYSELLNGDGNGLPVDTAGREQTTEPTIREQARLHQEGLTINDANQVRMGIEWAIAKAPAVFLLRLGTWYDPNHQVQFIDKTNSADRITSLRSLEVAFPDRPDEWHFAAGLGVTFSSRFQIDGAVDISPRVNTVSISSVFYFK